MAILEQPTQYTAIFTSRTGPGMAHVWSVPHHQTAWTAVATKFLDHGQLVALVPGHHPLIMSGTTLHKRADAEAQCFLAG